MNGNDRQRPKLLRKVINAVLAGIRTRQAELQAEALHPGDHDAESYFTRNPGPADRFMGSGPKGVAKRGHEGIEPSTSPTLKENHTTRPMARAGGACTARGNRGGGWDKTKKMRGLLGVGFEPTPPERLELESSALDHSAIQPTEGARESPGITRVESTIRGDPGPRKKDTPQLHGKIRWAVVG